MLQKHNLLVFNEQIEFLSVLFSEPNEFLKHSIEDESLIKVLQEVFENYDFKDLKASLDDREVYEKIKRDWLYLYVGVSGPLATPYASTYYRRTSRLMDKPAKDILAIIKRWGIEVDDSYRDLPDHLSSILQVISVLLEIALYDERYIIEKEAVADIYTISKDTSKWIEEMKARTEEHETTKFYSIVADLITKTLEKLVKECELILQ